MTQHSIYIVKVRPELLKAELAMIKGRVYYVDPNAEVDSMVNPAGTTFITIAAETDSLIYWLPDVLGDRTYIHATWGPEGTHIYKKEATAA